MRNNIIKKKVSKLFSEPLLDVKNISKIFYKKKSKLFKPDLSYKAVDNISFTINPGETLGLVGESGCGKSTIAKLIVKLHDPTLGDIYFNGVNYKNIKKKDLINFRKKVQIIFQDPYSSLNPRIKIGKAISEPLMFHNIIDSHAIKDEVISLLNQVGLNKDHFNSYPNAFSGGQRQRICIARALTLKPDLLIADEPVSSLDVSIQAQIINLLINLQKTHNMSYLFISHDLAVVKYISDRIIVMYLGRIVEIAKNDELFRSPKHPYTQALLSSIPQPEPKNRNRDRLIISGDVQKLFLNENSCCFSSRCKFVTKQCETINPIMTNISDSHKVACHLYNK